MRIEDALHFSESMLFPVWIIDLHGEAGKIFIEQHWHTELEFVTIVKGSCIITVGENVYLMTAGQSLFIHGALLHQAVAGELGCHLQGFVFSRSLLTSKKKMYVDEAFWDRVFSEKFNLITYMKGKKEWEKEAAEEIREVYELCKTKSYAFELLVKARIDSLLFNMLQNSSGRSGIKTSRTNGYKDELWKEICDYIHQNLQQQITITDISKNLNISQRSVSRCAQKYGITVGNYINLCRIHKSCKILQNTEKSITEIAVNVGFGDSSYFTVIFKRYMGCTPTQYREIVNHNLAAAQEEMNE